MSNLGAKGCLVVLGLATMVVGQRSPGPVPSEAAVERSVFDEPQRGAKREALVMGMLQLARAGKLAEVEALLAQALGDVDLATAETHYNLACVRAILGRADEALASLAAAVELGFANHQHLRADPDLESLRDLPRFAELAAAAEGQAAAPPDRSASPREVVDGVAEVSEGNTAWVLPLRRFLVAHLFQPPAVDVPITSKPGPVGELLNGWQAEGTAAGLHGFLYDNRDRGHSRMKVEQFPQLARLVYGEPARNRRLDHGAQLAFLHDAPTIGNASLAQTSGPFWRSMSRSALVDARAVQMLADQYLNHHLYVYPEHRDHDGDFGDVFAANTAYLLTSQGSSGSDQQFLEALACTLAAFRPDTRRLLLEQHLLMPTVQMILRLCRRPIVDLDGYFTGQAHPAVFAGDSLDVERMVRLANRMMPDEVPPLVRLAVVEEDEAVLGVDYFEAQAGERLFDSVSAIARVGRASRWQRRLVVDVGATVDPNGLPLVFHWRLLRGEPERVRIRLLNAEGTRAELLVAWHAWGTPPGAGIAGSRVDIGVFAHNGKQVSAPAFVTWYFPANEKRTYDESGRIAAVEFLPASKAGSYVDPAVVTPANWQDSYRYAAEGGLLGWSRQRPDQPSEEFTRDGALISRRDPLGRPLEARTVVYRRTQSGKDGWPELLQAPGVEQLEYAYRDEHDQFGEIVRRQVVGQPE